MLKTPLLIHATAVAILLSASTGEARGAETSAERILDQTGVTGGLIVHLGCGDGKLTAELGAGDGYLVHGLDVDADAVGTARAYIQSTGVYGKVSVDTFDGKSLPYVDDLVNLIVVEKAGRVANEELLRVLAPGGVKYVKSGDRWSKTVKPWPDEIDEWTHHLHGPGGNAVSADLEVGPPARLRWTAGPIWARSHGWTPSVSAMVSAGGRLFYICDETLACADATVPSKWSLTARDAFSGVLLWKCPIERWGSAQFSGTPDIGGGGVVGRFTMPTNIGKRLVAVGDTVYVTLAPDAPVTALDASTGAVKQVYADTARADEILVSDGRLIVSINPDKKRMPEVVAIDQTPPPAPGKQVCAVDAQSGRLLWKKGPFSGIRTGMSQDPFGRLELATSDGKVFVLTPKTIECIAADSGEAAWRIDRPALPSTAVTRRGFAGMYEYLLEVMVYHDGVVLLAQPEPNTHHTYHTMPGSLYAFNAADGRQLWRQPYGGWGHCTPPDVFVVGDVVWTHVNAETEFGNVWGSGYKALDSSKVDYRIQALDLRTGEVRRELATRDIFDVGHHHRCYRNKITERFLLSCRRGVEFVDLATGDNYQNHWVRSGCLLGYLPTNGLLYVTPHPCGCYISAKINGFNALATEKRDEEQGRGGDGESETSRLQRGPAYIPTASSLQPTASSSTDWPTYRHDPQRSGATESVVGTDIEIVWQTGIDGMTSGLTVAGGKVVVSAVDSHTVYALDAADGEQLWQYTAAARVDSPPTLYGPLAIFGSTDGQVHCLGAGDGQLVWRFGAAPRRRLLTAFGQLESPWPVPGSVLVADGKCWLAAGRSSYLDGGIHLWALDPANGQVIHSETIYSPDPDSGKMIVEPDPHAMSGLLNDIPVTDGTDVFIRQMNVSTPGRDGTGGHLFTTGGFLDPSWFNRTYWQFGRAKTSGLMVLGDGVAFGTELYESRSRETVFSPGRNAYRLQCIGLAAPAQQSGKKAVPKGPNKGQAPLWEKHLEIRVTAMVRAADVVFVAGSPDVVDPADPYAAWEGRKGGLVLAYSAADGEQLGRYELPAPPVWDGMAVAAGRLFVGTTDGSVVCLGEKSGR